jgi:hypothetical protein
MTTNPPTPPRRQVTVSACGTDHPPGGPARHGGPVWTPERIRALGPVTTVPVAASIFGLSRSVAYELIRLRQFPVPVLRFGTRYRIPVAAILTALHLPTDPDPDPGSARSAGDRRT